MVLTTRDLKNTNVFQIIIYGQSLAKKHFQFYLVANSDESIKLEFVNVQNFGWFFQEYFCWNLLKFYL